MTRRKWGLSVFDEIEALSLYRFFLENSTLTFSKKKKKNLHRLQKKKNTSDAIEACKNLPPEDEAACMLALGCDAKAVHARLDAEEEAEARKKAEELAVKK